MRRYLAGCPAGDLDLSLNRYSPLVEGRDHDLLDSLRTLAEVKKQARDTHAVRAVKRFGLPIRTRAEFDSFIIKSVICAILVE